MCLGHGVISCFAQDQRDTNDLNPAHSSRVPISSESQTLRASLKITGNPYRSKTRMRPKQPGMSDRGGCHTLRARFAFSNERIVPSRTFSNERFLQKSQNALPCRPSALICIPEPVHIPASTSQPRHRAPRVRPAPPSLISLPQVNLRFNTKEARALGVEGHVCEVRGASRPAAGRTRIDSDGARAGRPSILDSDATRGPRRRRSEAIALQVPSPGTPH
jgi:hypothetical protein